MRARSIRRHWTPTGLRPCSAPGSTRWCRTPAHARIPDDGKDYPLPAGLGQFALRLVDDYAAQVPARWREHGGVFLPMYQAEARWLNFDSDSYPFAMKIAAGKITAVTGDTNVHLPAWKLDKTTNPHYIPAIPWTNSLSGSEKVGLVKFDLVLCIL